jgi:hypothetical protein
MRRTTIALAAVLATTGASAEPEKFTPKLNSSAVLPEGGYGCLKWDDFLAITKAARYGDKEAGLNMVMGHCDWLEAGTTVQIEDSRPGLYGAFHVRPNDSADAYWVWSGLTWASAPKPGPEAAKTARVGGQERQVTLAAPMVACKNKIGLLLVNGTFEKDEAQGWLTLGKLVKAKECTAANDGDKVSIVDDRDREWVRVRIGDDWEAWWTVSAFLKGAKVGPAK